MPTWIYRDVSAELRPTGGPASVRGWRDVTPAPEGN
jgi:hypothetical protein